MFYIYILRCADNSLYTGLTNNLQERVLRHNHGHGCNYTKIRLPVTLEYFEKFKTIAEAAKREKQLKGWNKLKKENLIKFEHPNPSKI